MTYNNNIFKSILIAGCVFFAAAGVSSAQTKDTLTLRVNYPDHSAVVEGQPQNNETRIEEFKNAFEQLRANPEATIEKIEVFGSASPFGLYDNNMNLSEQRAKNLCNLVGINPDSVSVSHAINWKDLEGFINVDDNVPDKEDILKIINTTEEIFITREGKRLELRKLRLIYFDEGKPWAYLKENYYDFLRYSQIDVYYTVPAEPVVEAAPEIVEEQPIAFAPAVVEPQPEPEPEPEPMPIVEKKKKEVFLPPFALKTNIAFDAVLALNVELEIPLGKRFSIAAEWMQPWWLPEKWNWCYEARSLTIEPKIWLGDRVKKQMLNGWFVSVYGNIGDYDFQKVDKGYQGRFLNVGAGVGYSFALGKHFGIELMAGAGWLTTKYEVYTPGTEYHKLQYQYTEKTTWLGPTRAKASLIYRFNVNTYNRNHRSGK